MPTENSIPAIEFCALHHIEISFIHSLGDAGLLKTDPIRETGSIPPDQLQELEKFVRMRYELDINLEGIEAIVHLLERERYMRQEITRLQNKLSLYEPIRRTSGPLEDHL
jgi:hypothetical protein